MRHFGWSAPHYPHRLKKIIRHEKRNPNLRIVGMTATPYRLGTGYIYEMDENNQLVDETVKPYFKKLLINIGAKFLIEQGYLTPIPYRQNWRGTIRHFAPWSWRAVHIQQNQLMKPFVGHGKKDSRYCRGRNPQCERHECKKCDVFSVQRLTMQKKSWQAYPLIIQHWLQAKHQRQNVNRSLPTLKRKKSDTLVNISVYTGFDCTSVSIIAVLRKTESASLLQQIIGRALRLHDGKEYSLLLDYADNVNTHFPRWWRIQSTN